MELSQWLGFKHNFSPTEEGAKARFLQASIDSDGRTWQPFERHATQIAAFIIPSGAAVLASIELANRLSGLI